jgi:hypothetical protein
MAETIGPGGEEDDVLKYIREVIDTLQSDAPDTQRRTHEDAGLRYKARNILHDDSMFKPRDYDEASPALGGLTRRTLDARIHETVANHYLIASSPETIRHREQYVGAPPGERTGRAHCLAAASDPSLVALDMAASAVDKRLSSLRTFLRADSAYHRDKAFNELYEIRRSVMVQVAEAYGVDPRTIWLSPDGLPLMTFRHNGNAALISALARHDDLEVSSWSDGLPRAEQLTVREEYNNLIREGMPLAHLYRYTQGERIPRQLRHLEPHIIGDAQDIGAAYGEHQQRLRDYALARGFRQFRVRSPQMHWGLSVAMHVLEQSPAETYDIIGPFSPTEGNIAVDAPGYLGRDGEDDVTPLGLGLELNKDGKLRRAGGLTEPQGWKVTDNGRIAPVQE